MPSPKHLSSARADWQTPEYFLDLVRQVSTIDLDPCAPVLDNPVRAHRRLTRLCCGLSSEWRPSNVPTGLIYINPPYGPYLGGPIDPEWLHMKNGEVVGKGRGWAEKIAQDPGPWIALLPNRTDTDWFRTVWDASDMRLLWNSPTLGKRIKFVNPVTGKPASNNTTGSVVFFNYGSVCGGVSADRFEDAFGPHGILT